MTQLRDFFLRSNKSIFNNNSIILLICIFIALIFWLLNALSKPYVADIRVHVDYINQPQNQVVVNELPDHLVLKVQNIGWQLLRDQFNISNHSITIDVARFGENNVFYTNTNLDYFNTQLAYNYEVIRVTPGLINFEFDSRSEKKVPVFFNANISLDPLYGFSDTIQLIPDSISIIGPSVIVDTINSVYTQHVSLRNLNRSITNTVRLIEHPSPTVSFNRQTVEYRIEVETFTESRLEVPITIINPPLQRVMLLSNTATISFQIPLARFQSVDNAEFRNQFEVVADFADITENDREVRLRIISHPQYVKRVQVSPRNVGFLYVR